MPPQNQAKGAGPPGTPNPSPGVMAPKHIANMENKFKFRYELTMLFMKEAKGQTEQMNEEKLVAYHTGVCGCLNNMIESRNEFEQDLEGFSNYAHKLRKVGISEIDREAERTLADSSTFGSIKPIAKTGMESVANRESESNQGKPSYSSVYQSWNGAVVLTTIDYGSHEPSESAINMGVGEPRPKEEPVQGGTNQTDSAILASHPKAWSRASPPANKIVQYNKLGSGVEGKGAPSAPDLSTPEARRKALALGDETNSEEEEVYHPPSESEVSDSRNPGTFLGKAARKHDEEHRHELKRTRNDKAC